MLKHENLKKLTVCLFLIHLCVFLLFTGLD